MDLSKIARDDWLVVGGGIALLIDLLFLPWYHVDFLGLSFSRSATSSPYAIWGVLALIVALVVIGDLLLARFSPQTQLPTTQLGRGMTRAALAVVVLVLLIIKLLAHTGELGFGAVLGLVLAVLVVSGAYRVAALP